MQYHINSVRPISTTNFYTRLQFNGHKANELYNIARSVFEKLEYSVEIVFQLVSTDWHSHVRDKKVKTLRLGTKCIGSVKLNIQAFYTSVVDGSGKLHFSIVLARGK
jgi:hypothetical protein